MSNKSELNYRIHVEPAMFNILNQISADVASLGVSEEDFTRALWVYTDTKLSNLTTPPSWIWAELDRKQQEADAQNTVDGEVGG
jgi:hypothetical protein